MIRWLLLGLMAPATASAFVTTLGDETRWRFPPTWSLGTPTVDLPRGVLDVMLARSFQPWTEVADVEFPLRRVDGPSDIVVQFPQAWPPELGAAVTGNTITTTSGGFFVRAEIYLNDAVLDFTDQPDQARTYLPGVLTHEVGHALGLAHSPRLDATMYWHYQGADGATLSADDARGLRFLYGAREPGLACDTCVLGSDCADACLGVEPGRGYCGGSCAGGCPDGFDCVALQGGGESCWPRVGTCDDRGVGLRGRGETCWGTGHCRAPLRCAVLPGTALCTADCAQDADCLVGERCLLGYGGSTVCGPVGAGGPGEGCHGDIDCAAGLCLGPRGARACRRTCGVDDQCAPGERCVGLASPTGTWGGCVAEDDVPADSAGPPTAAEPASDTGGCQATPTPAAWFCLLFLLGWRRGRASGWHLRRDPG